MKQGHPLKKRIRNIQNSLNRLCSVYAGRLEDSINPVYFNAYSDRLNLNMTAADFIEEVSREIKSGTRDAIQITLDLLEKQTGQALDPTRRLMLEAKIENELKRTFAGKTLRQRIDGLERFTRNLLHNTYRQKQAGLNPSFYDAFSSPGVSVTFWVNRLVVSEMLRTYHYVVKVFAKETSARDITFVFDQKQLDRRKEYKELADGGPYQVDDLPDYPRPYASYLLKISY